MRPARAGRGALDAALLDEHADEAPGDGAVGAGPRLQMHVRLLGDLRPARIDDDELQAPNLLREKVAEEPVGRGPGAVLADDHRALRLRIRAAGDLRAVAELDGMDVGEVARDRALAPVVGAAEVARETHDGRPRLLRVAAVEEHAVGAVFRLHAVESLRDHADRLVPADPHPARIGRALGRRALHRIKEPVRVVEALKRRDALRAEEVVRMLLPVLDADHGVAARLEMNAAHRHVVARVADGPAGPFLLRVPALRTDGKRLEERRGIGGPRALEQGAA